ncbi:MAG TPA: SHOCT domain-containing protein [Gemmataceae bacterium]|nr:SHOCT domain-containing protein [Gemmataceae bacterium]
MLRVSNSVWAFTLSLELLGAIVLFVGPVVLGIVVIVWAARRYKRPPTEVLTAEEELARYRTLLEEGELSPDEFERIRARLSEEGRGARGEGRG